MKKGADNVIAELHNKVGGNAVSYERSEDELTGNFFGMLRYIPFNKGMKQVITKTIYPNNLADFIEGIDVEEWSSCIKFWPRYEEDDKHTEMDGVIDLGDIILGIEVKYRSGISSDDDINEKEQEMDSCNQLSREAKLLDKIGGSKKKVLILVAKQLACDEIYNDAIQRIDNGDVHIGYISWQKILEALDELKDLNPYESLIIEDLRKLLIKKGFEQFKNFNVDIEVERSYWSFDNIFNLNLNYDFKAEISKEDYYEFGK